MNAAIDIGNTRIKVGLFDAGIMLDSKLTNNGQEVVELLAKISLQNVMISSVGENPSWIESMAKKTHVVYLDKNTRLPITVDYKTPETLGMDRLAAAVGAYNRYKGKNCLIIDMGTCITYDLIDDQGCFQGGSISPGIRMRFRAMHEQTASLPLIEDYGIQLKIPGKSTHESMISGTILGIKQEIEGFVRSYQDKVSNLQIIFTGGDFKVVENLLNVNHEWADYLVLEGLNGILEYNTI